MYPLSHLVVVVLCIGLFALCLGFACGVMSESNSERDRREKRNERKMYACKHPMTGVVALVGATDYERETDLFWERVKRGEALNPGLDGPALKISPVVLFLKDQRALLEQLAMDGYVERRTFFVPPYINVSGSRTEEDYHGVTVLSYEQLWSVLHDGAPYKPVVRSTLFDDISKASIS